MAEYVLLKQYCTSNQVLYVYVYMYYTALPSTPRYQICTSATLPTYNFEKSKINFNQCNFVNINIYILKQCSKKSSYDDLKTTMKVNESKYKIMKEICENMTAVSEIV